MKIKLIIAIFLIFIGGLKSYAQMTELIKDSIEIQEFNIYANSILAFNRDSIIPDSLPNKYQIIYMTGCDFITEDNLGPNCRCYTVGRSLGRNHFNSVIMTPRLYICGESPTKVKNKITYFVYLDSSTNNYITYPEIINIGGDNSTAPKIMSFQNNKYLIMEESFIVMFGSQTSTGITRTIFLEKIE
jgi:hypothetical protein